MINTTALRGLIIASGQTQRDFARKMGVSEATFYNKMKRGKFDSDEMSYMIKELGIADPVRIFFAELVP